MAEAAVTQASAVSSLNPYAAYSAGNKYPIAFLLDSSRVTNEWVRSRE
jgi:hypothetical protein